MAFSTHSFAEDAPLSTDELYRKANEESANGNFRGALDLLLKGFDPKDASGIDSVTLFYCALEISLGNFDLAEPMLLEMATVPEAATSTYHKASVYRQLVLLSLLTGDFSRAVFWEKRALAQLGEGPSYGYEEHEAEVASLEVRRKVLETQLSAQFALLPSRTRWTSRALRWSRFKRRFLMAQRSSRLCNREPFFTRWARSSWSESEAKDDGRG